MSYEERHVKPMSDPAETSSRLRRAAGLLLDYPYQGWFYGDSIGFEGLLAATELFGDDRYETFAHAFILGWATRAEPYREMDNTVAGRALCVLAERTGDARLLEAGKGVAEYLRSRPTIGDGAWVSFADAPLREPYGGAQLAPAEIALMSDTGPGVYLDCLHFDPPFFVHLGRLLGDTELVDAGAAQALAYVSMLQDRDSGLFRHFWLEQTQRAYIPGWGRGQGWALLGLLDVLEELPRSHAAWAPLSEAMLRLAAALAATQRSDGSWWAMVHEPESGNESSTAAFMAAGFHQGVEHGWLERETYLPRAERAWQAALAAVADDGELTDVSAAVWSSTSQSHYHHVPRGFVVPWGQGPLLQAAAIWTVPATG
jgi:unsaturated rhamnogalacturonyl hydrolase